MSSGPDGGQRSRSEKEKPPEMQLLLMGLFPLWPLYQLNLHNMSCKKGNTCTYSNMSFTIINVGLSGDFYF